MILPEITFNIDPLMVPVLLFLIRQGLRHERIIAVLQNDCPKIQGNKQEV